MKIESIRIKNFRALKNVSIPFDSVTTLIGPNGAGKSTVLRALDWFFNGAPGQMSDGDCSFGASNEEIEVQVTFSELTENDRKELGKYAPQDVTTFTAWKQRKPDGAETMSANSKSHSPFNVIRSKATAAEKKAAYNDLRSSDNSLALPGWTSVDAANQAMTSWEANNTDQLVDAPEALQTNFFGFNSNGKMSGLFDFVLVTADLRASEESVDGKSSIIGRILERSINRAAADSEIAAIVEESRLKQQKVFEEKFQEQLKTITIQLNEIVASYSPGRTVGVAPAEVALKAPRTTFEVSVLDSGTETAVERQGHGFQRTLLISALQLLARSGTASAEGVICLAIEEPELFQHPTQAQTFAKVLRSLAEDVGKRIQVVYATHSPYFLEARRFHQIRRLVRSIGETPVVSVHFGTLSRIIERLHGTIDAPQVSRQLDGIVSGRLSNALFAAHALIVEGDTEAAILYGIGDRRTVGFLESIGVSIVPAGGKGAIPLAHAILESLGIPTYVVFDSDSKFEERAIAKGKTQVQIAAERTNIASENRRLLRYFGKAEVDFPQESVGDGLATLDDHLESLLEAQWPEWVELYAEIELAAGMSLPKNQYAYRTATLESKGVVPELLTKILARVREA